tara:strand:+ start:9125 stop:10516 length:1392 start_codon:yes stop_codon:yes gene_type:complete
MASLFNADLINPNAQALEEQIRSATERAQNFGLLNGGTGIGGLVSAEAERQLKALTDQRRINQETEQQRQQTPAQKLAAQQGSYFDSIINEVFPTITESTDATTDPFSESESGKTPLYGDPGGGYGVGGGGVAPGSGMSGYKIPNVTDPKGTYGVGTYDTYGDNPPDLYNFSPEEYAANFSDNANYIFGGGKANAIASSPGGIGAFANMMFNEGAVTAAEAGNIATLDLSKAEDMEAFQAYLERSAVSEAKDALSERVSDNPDKSRFSGGNSSGTMGFTKGDFGPGMSDRALESLKDGSGGLFGGSDDGGDGGDDDGDGESDEEIGDFGMGRAADLASAMNTLYGGAGSSFESGRNEYTESGQYDRDREARQAEFDAMRNQQRIDAGLPYKRLTSEETQQAVLDQRERIGGEFRSYLQNIQAPDTTGAYAAGVADRARAAAEAEINQGIAPFMGVPFGVGGRR